MKQRIMIVPMTEVAFDSQAVAARIQKLCDQPPFRIVTGGGVVRGTLFLALEPCPSELPVPTYVMSRLTSTAADEVAATVSQRYVAGYATVVLAAYADAVWGLFARAETGEDE